MHRHFRPLMILCRGVLQRNFKFKINLEAIPNQQFHTFQRFFPPHHVSNLGKFRSFHLHEDPTLNNHDTGFLKNPESEPTDIDRVAIKVQNLLKEFPNSSDEELSLAFDDCGVSLSDDLVLNVLRRNSSDWKPAFRFFNWVSKGVNPSGYSPGSGVYNEMLGVLGKMKRFEEVDQVFDEMSKRGVVNERSYGIVVHRYAASHRIDDAINFFYKRKQYGLKLDLIAFQTLLMALCRYKHVEAAEFLFHLKKGEFQYDTKIWNIILNGWCVLGNLRETKRFWNEIIRSKCKPDKVTYGTFINSLCKAGKISTVAKLFHAMWERGCTPDVVICNNVIDGLCFKKRIPEALEIFREMNEKDCHPDVATYNCLIKHLCKIQRMEVVFELLGQMEEKGGNCSPNARTYSHLLNSSKKPDEVSSLLERMKKTGCKMLGDTYNLLLRLYMQWNCEEHVQSTWTEMVRHGLGPDQRSYTIMVHGLYEQGRIEDAQNYFKEMTSKGMVPEQRTMLLVDAMNIKSKERGVEDATNTKLSGHACRRGRKNIS